MAACQHHVAGTDTVGRSAEARAPVHHVPPPPIPSYTAPTLKGCTNIPGSTIKGYPVRLQIQLVQLYNAAIPHKTKGLFVVAFAYHLAVSDGQINGTRSTQTLKMRRNASQDSLEIRENSLAMTYVILTLMSSVLVVGQTAHVGVTCLHVTSAMPGSI